MLRQIIWNKFKYELDGLLAMAKYPLERDTLLNQLSNSMSYLNVETTNICNANCIFCAYQYQERPTGVMDMALFHKIIDEYVECGGGALGLTPTVGEPMVDPQLLARIAYARSKPEITEIGMYSNMISLEKVGAEALVNSGLTGLTVSVSGLDVGMYQRVYRSKQYPRVLRNIKAFAEANNRAGRPVDFRLDMRVDRPHAEVTESPDFKDVAALIGADRLLIKFRYDDWSGKIAPDDLSGNMRLRKPAWFRRPRISPCTEMFNGPMVYWDGTVGACGCRDVNASQLVIGNATTTHLADIWFGEEIAALRARFLTSDSPSICANCAHYNNVSIYLRADSKSWREGILPARRKSAAQVA